MPLREEKECIGILKGMPHYTRKNILSLMISPEDPTDESHAISCEDNTGALINTTLALKGVTSYIFPQGSQPSMNLRIAQGLN